MQEKEYKIKINIIFSRILDHNDINMESIEFTTRKMVNDLNQKYLGLNVIYQGMDIDAEIQNLIFIRIQATFYNSTHFSSHISNIGKSNCKNLKVAFDEDLSLEDYFLEKMNFSIFEITTSQKIIT